MNAKTDKRSANAWCRSARFREIARQSGLRNQAAFKAAPRCGAKRKSDGEPCSLPAMENGRCYLHGGKTPKGREWHRPQWPDKSSPDAEKKLAAKLEDLERRQKRRAQRLAKMTPEERQRYDLWHRTHKPGSPGARAADRERRKQALFARGMLSDPGRSKPANKEAADLQREIDALRLQLRELQSGNCVEMARQRGKGVFE